MDYLHPEAWGAGKRPQILAGIGLVLVEEYLYVICIIIRVERAKRFPLAAVIHFLSMQVLFLFLAKNVFPEPKACILVEATLAYCHLYGVVGSTRKGFDVDEQLVHATYRFLFASAVGDSGSSVIRDLCLFTNNIHGNL